MARERQRVALEAIPRVLSVLGSYPIRPRRPSPARLCGHPPFWIGRFLRARSFLSKALPSPLALTPGGVEHPWLGSSTGTSNRLRMSWRLCRHWLRSATRDPLFDRSSPIGPGKNLGCNHISSHRLVDCQGSFFRLCSDLKIPWQVAPSEVEEPPWALAAYFREISRLRWEQRDRVLSRVRSK